MLYSHLLKHKNRLLKRDNENRDFWFTFGRSQAITDTYKNKLAINSIIKQSSNLKIINVPSGSGVYSGLYIISENISFEKIKQVLLEEEFGIYVSLLGKYKNGGYYTFSTKNIKTYLDYKLGEKNSA